MYVYAYVIIYLRIFVLTCGNHLLLIIIISFGSEILKHSIILHATSIILFVAFCDYNDYGTKRDGIHY